MTSSASGVVGRNTSFSRMRMPAGAPSAGVSGDENALIQSTVLPASAANDAAFWSILARNRVWNLDALRAAFSAAAIEGRVELLDRARERARGDGDAEDGAISALDSKTGQRVAFELEPRWIVEAARVRSIRQRRRRRNTTAPTPTPPSATRTHPTSRETPSGTYTITIARGI